MQKLKAFFFIMSLGLSVVSTQATTVDTNAIMKERYSIKEPEKINIPPKKYLGEFLLTAYCNCRECCGQWAGGPCFNEEMPKANYTIAVDTDVIPLNSFVTIEGVNCIDENNKFKAQDTGNWIRGKHIDVYFNNHQEALNFGRKTAKVYLERK